MIGFYHAFLVIWTIVEQTLLHSRSEIVRTQVWMQILCQMTAIALSSRCMAQVVPDQTLPLGERSQVSGNPNTQINGGAIRGSNLFHSFQQFSIPTGGSVVFNNGSTITNIINRVTGSSRSDIDGLIRANGTANVFLINPNGILFGANARLEIGGSFLASTANSLIFDDGYSFSSINPQVPPLLTISTPIGLRFGNKTEPIRVQGNGQELRDFVANSPLIDTTKGLQVPFNQTLALVGGEISLEGALLKTAGGRIELGSVLDNSLVSLTPTGKGFALGYDAVQNFGAIQLFQRAYVDASGEGGGDISIQGGRIVLAGASTIEASTLRAKPGGSFTINARSSLEITGGDTLAEESGLFAVTYPKTTGSGGNLTINTPTLLVRNGGEISVSTFAEGTSGNIAINAPQSLQLIGTSKDGMVRGGLFARANGTIGAAGNLTLDTGTLIIRDGAQLSVGTRSAGNSGNIIINATQGVELSGTSAKREFSSGLFAQANAGASGAGGNITVNTPTLLMQNGAIIAGGTLGEGSAGSITINAPQGIHLIGTSPSGEQSSGLFLFAALGSTGAGGDLTINTSDLLVEKGAAVTVGTDGAGNAGTLTVNATDAVKVIGSSFDGRYPSALAASAELHSTGAAGKLFINTPSLLVQNGAAISAATSGTGDGGELSVNAPNSVLISGSDFTGRVSALRTLTEGSGNGGSLSIFTTRLQVQNKAEITVGSTGIGRSGNLQIQANSINLDNQASLSASTTSDRSGNQANITLTSNNLVLRHGSRITTNATGSANGGNINLKSDFIIAVPKENSDISANAKESLGGRVIITAEGIFGIQLRDRLTPLSDITATSDLGSQFNGVVTINKPDVDLNRGLVALPTELIDPNVLIANSCVARRRRQGRFVITGTGGLATQPDDLANAAFPTYELVPDPAKAENVRPSPSTSVTEPDRIYHLANGAVVLGRSCE